MYSFIAAVGIVLVFQIAHFVCNAPNVVQKLFDHAENLRFRGPGRAYFAILVTYPLAVFAVAFGLATVAGLFIGFAQAWYDVGMMFVLIFFMFFVFSFFSFLGDVGSLAASVVANRPRGAAQDVRLLSTIVFVSSGYGSLACALMKMNGVFVGIE